MNVIGNPTDKDAAVTAFQTAGVEWNKHGLT